MKAGDRVGTGKMFGGKCLFGCNTGTVLVVYGHGSKIGVQFDAPIPGGHNCRGRGAEGYCYYGLANEVSMLGGSADINGGGKMGMIKSFIDRILDPDTLLIKESVMDSQGNLNMNDPRVQIALLNTDGFRTNLLAGLKADKAEAEKKK